VGGRKNNLLHFAVRNVLEGVEILVMRGNFNAAFPAGRTVEIPGAGIIEYPAVNDEMVIMKTFFHRLCGCAHPDTVCIFREGGAPASDQAQFHGNALGLRRLDTESRVTLRIDLWVSLAVLVKVRRLEVLQHRLICLRHAKLAQRSGSYGK